MINDDDDNDDADVGRRIDSPRLPSMRSHVHRLTTWTYWILGLGGGGHCRIYGCARDDDGGRGTSKQERLYYVLMVVSGKWYI